MIPALIVSGFLGSGKTSLVRALLRQAQQSGTRVAVISNEFGELGIDKALLGEGSESFVELEGGCVCCQLSNELVDTLEVLRNKVKPDRIIIETSGVALPGETQMNLWRDPVRNWISDDTAVVVVNAEQVLEERDLKGTFEYQLTSADLLVLNKIDLVSAAAVPAIEERLRQIEPEAPILRCEHGELDVSILFPPEPDGLRNAQRESARKPAPHVHEHFRSDVVTIEPGTAEEALLSRIRALGTVRAKGFVETNRGVRLLQSVGERVQLHALTEMPSKELIGKVVLIWKEHEPQMNTDEHG